MAYSGRNRDRRPGWRYIDHPRLQGEEWLLSFAQAAAMLAFSVLLRWIVS